MVNKRRYHEGIGEPPPPMNESWWEAVLAEDEAQCVARPFRNSRTPGMANHLEPATAEPTDAAILDWRTAFEIFEQDQVITLIVTGANRGGLLVHGEKLQGFVPVSHLVDVPCQENDLEKWLTRYLDQQLNLKIIECDQERGRVVFSERAAQSRPGSRKELLCSLHPGTCTSGVVTNITDFGVFVDLGGIEGLVHVSEISWGRVQHPSEVVTLGQEVDVYVIQVDQERGRVALSLKRLHANPWETAEKRYFPGQVTDAVVTSIVPFGAFARLEEGLDGLIHVSEFGHNNGAVEMGHLVKEGQHIRVRILHVDAIRQRLGLSLNLNGEPVV
jgi:small subunit ribosomal protein S1